MKFSSFVARRLRGSLLLFLGTLLSGTALACGHSGSTDYCGPELIAQIYAPVSGDVYVQPSSSWTGNGVVCAPISGKYALLPSSAPNFKQIYATLVSAKLSGYQVTMVMDRAQTQCTIAYITLQ